MNDEKRREFMGVQCLRFFAAFLVVVTHATFYTHERLTNTSPVWDRGAIGVDIFFVISGFVMLMSSEKYAYRRLGWAEFAMRRLVRVGPPYWIATTAKLIVLLAAPSLVLHSELDWLYVLKSYLFLPAYNVEGRIEPLLGVGWTLIFEMFFYLLFTLGVALRTNVLVFCGTILTICAFGSLFRTEQGSAYQVFLTPLVLEFFIGMLIARYLTRYRVPIFVSLTMIACGLFFLFFDFIGSRGIWFWLNRFVVAGALVAGVVALESRMAGQYPKALILLGAASYSLYLFHPLSAPLAPEVFRRLDIGFPFAAISSSVALAIIAGLVAYFVLERPLHAIMAKGVRRLLPRSRS